jgi:hypothetical protein
MSFKELPGDMSKKQKGDLLDLKVIEFEDMLEEITEK